MKSKDACFALLEETLIYFVGLVKSIHCFPTDIQIFFATDFLCHSFTWYLDIEGKTTASFHQMLSMSPRIIRVGAPQRSLRRLFSSRPKQYTSFRADWVAFGIALVVSGGWLARQQLEVRVGRVFDAYFR